MPQPKQVSLLQQFSLGVAAENKSQNTRQLRVVPIESLPMLDGELGTNTKAVGYKGVAADQSNYEGTINTGNHIVAEWLPRGSNRLTPPDIRRGERVMIWRYDTTDKYYWEYLGLDDAKRRLETITFGINADPDVESDGPDYVLKPENCYFIEMSTHTGQVTFQTSMLNGEAAQYKTRFDTKNGTFTLVDDKDNKIFIDSTRSYLSIQNEQGCVLEMDQQAIRLTAPQTIDVKAEARITLTVGGTSIELTPGALSLITAALSMKAGTIAMTQG